MNKLATNMNDDGKYECFHFLPLFCKEKIKVRLIIDLLAAPSVEFCLSHLSLYLHNASGAEEGRH